MFSPKGNINNPSLLSRLRDHWGRRGRNNLRTRIGRWLQENIIYWIQKRTYELSVGDRMYKTCVRQIKIKFQHGKGLLAYNSTPVMELFNVFFCSGKEIDSLFLCFIKYIFHTIHSDHSFPYLLSFQILPTPAHPPNYTPSFVLPLENKQANNKPTRIKQNKKEKQKKSKK